MIFDITETTKHKFTFARMITMALFAILCLMGIFLSILIGFVGWGWFIFTIMFITIAMFLIESERCRFKEVRVEINEGGITVEKNGKAYRHDWADVRGARLVQSNRLQRIAVMYDVQIVRNDSISDSGYTDIIPGMTDYLVELTNAINDGVKLWSNHDRSIYA